MDGERVAETGDGFVRIEKGSEDLKSRQQFERARCVCSIQERFERRRKRLIRTGRV